MIQKYFVPQMLIFKNIDNVLIFKNIDNVLSLDVEGETALIPSEVMQHFIEQVRRPP